MVICNSQYGVFIAGKWRWFRDKAAAMEVPRLAKTAPGWEERQAA